MAEDLLAIGALVTEWQERLCLRDWRISVEPVDQWKLGEKSRASEVEWDLCEKAAVMRFMPDGHPAVSTPPTGYDLEEAVAHELLHLHLAGQPRPANDDQNTMLEQGINAIARALVALRRAATPPTPPAESCDCCGQAVQGSRWLVFMTAKQNVRLCNPCGDALGIPVDERQFEERKRKLGPTKVSAEMGEAYA